MDKVIWKAWNISLQALFRKCDLMKRVFIIFSNLFVTSFLLWIAFISPNTVIYRSLPVVGVLKQERNITNEELSANLDQLARESNSVIARQIQQTDSQGQIKFSYDIYGEGELPKGIKKADKEVASKKSLLTNYYILSGKLPLEKLDQKLHELAFSKTFMNKPNLLQNFMAFFGSGSQSLALVHWPLFKKHLNWGVQGFVTLQGWDVTNSLDVLSWKTAESCF